MCNNKQEFSEKVERYRKLTATAKKIDSELKAVKDEMMAYVNAKGKPKEEGSTTLVVFGDDYKVSVIITNNSTFDTDKLKAILGDDLSAYKKTSSSPRLDVR